MKGNEKNKIIRFQLLWLILVMLVATLSIDLLKNIYDVLIDNKNNTLNSNYILVKILFYNAACAVFWPTPSEAPLLLYPSIPLKDILIASCAGKILGSVIVYHSKTSLVNIFSQMPFKWKVVDLELKHNKISASIKKYGFLAYLVMQSIPLFPMRSSLIIFCFLTKSIFPVIVGTAFGTIFRNLIVFFLFSSFNLAS